jgi:hypothetical protein
MSTLREVVGIATVLCGAIIAIWAYLSLPLYGQWSGDSSVLGLTGLVGFGLVACGLTLIIRRQA